MPFSLSSDIIDYLLTSLSDSRTLLSTILVSKSFYEVFRAHPSSILTSVATNQIGPELLPCAIRLTHFNRDKYLASRANYVQNFPSERKFSHNEAQAATPHLAALIKNDGVVRELELFFSSTCKDRASGTRSLLSPLESLRFRRALYRWWLLIYIFPPNYLLPTQTAGGNADNEGSDTEEDDDDDDDTDADTDDDDDDNSNNNNGIGGAEIDAPDVYHAKVQGLRKEFLSEFSNEEVAEIWQANNFMLFASNCARNTFLDPRINDAVLLWNGPVAAVEVFRSLRTFSEPSLSLKDQCNWDHGHSDADWPGIVVYLAEKDYIVPWLPMAMWDPVTNQNLILEDKVEDTEECDECHNSHLGPKLWSSANWHLLPCAVSFPEVLNSLPGYLKWNSHETMPLRAPPWSSLSYFNSRVSPGTPDWSEGKILCKPCVLKIMGRHALNLLREDKVQQGLQLEDCWYGYRCRTQRNPNHAIKLNHLCEPTRGD